MGENSGWYQLFIWDSIWLYVVVRISPLQCISNLSYTTKPYKCYEFMFLPKQLRSSFHMQMELISHSLPWVRCLWRPWQLCSKCRMVQRIRNEFVSPPPKPALWPVHIPKSPVHHRLTQHTSAARQTRCSASFRRSSYITSTLFATCVNERYAKISPS